jgi:hypothetical protein
VPVASLEEQRGRSCSNEFVLARFCEDDMVAKEKRKRPVQNWVLLYTRGLTGFTGQLKLDLADWPYYNKEKQQRSDCYRECKPSCGSKESREGCNKHSCIVHCKRFGMYTLEAKALIRFAVLPH